MKDKNSRGQMAVLVGQISQRSGVLYFQLQRRGIKGPHKCIKGKQVV